MGPYTANTSAGIAAQGVAALASTGTVGYDGIDSVTGGKRWGLNSCQTDHPFAILGGAFAIATAVASFSKIPQLTPVAGSAAVIVGLGAAAIRIAQKFSQKNAVFLIVGGRPPISVWGQ